MNANIEKNFDFQAAVHFDNSFFNDLSVFIYQGDNDSII